MHLNILFFPHQHFCFIKRTSSDGLALLPDSPPPVPLNLASNVVDSRRGELNLFFPLMMGKRKRRKIFSFKCDEVGALEGGISLFFLPLLPFSRFLISFDCLRSLEH